MREIIKAALEQDPELVSLLTGGIHTTEINRQNTPSAFDANNEVLPCMAIRIEGNSTIAPYQTGHREFILIYFYQAWGYDIIDEAVVRTFLLLHRQKLGQIVWRIDWSDDVRDQRDTALDCAMAYSRYVVIKRR